MRLLFTEWLSGPAAKAIGWTLVHSLWQGLLLTLLAGIIIIITRRAAASLRYRLLSFLLIAFVATTCITFIIEWQSAIKTTEKTITQSVITQPGNLSSVPLTLTSNIQHPTSDFLDQLTDYFNNNTPLIVAIWFIIFLFKCVRLTAHIGYAQRLRNYRTFALPDWQKRIEELSAQLKINAKVLIRESSIIKVPAVVGMLKPVILLPVGLLAKLPMDQVEAILLHELAHVRRKDYLVNILQCMAETIFFFNPSVLWLSSLIREERENCCDDIAIAVNGSRSAYVHALVAFQEYRTESVYATAFPRQQISRVKARPENYLQQQ